MKHDPRFVRETGFERISGAACWAAIMYDLPIGAEVVRVLLEVGYGFSDSDIPECPDQTNARKEVLPVLFSPTSRVSGARRAVCFSPKQR